MTPQIKLILIALWSTALLGSGGFAGWKVRDFTAQVSISNLEKKMADDKAKIADEKTKAANEAMKRQSELADHFAAIDKQKTEELKNANEKYLETLACIRRGNGCGLRVPRSTAGVPEATASGVDDAKADARQDGQASERVITVGHECDQAIYQLTGLQETIEEFNKSKIRNN